MAVYKRRNKCTHIGVVVVKKLEPKTYAIYVTFGSLLKCNRKTLFANNIA